MEKGSATPSLRLYVGVVDTTWEALEIPFEKKAPLSTGGPYSPNKIDEETSRSVE